MKKWEIDYLENLTFVLIENKTVREFQGIVASDAGSLNIEMSHIGWKHVGALFYNFKVYDKDGPPKHWREHEEGYWALMESEIMWVTNPVVCLNFLEMRFGLASNLSPLSFTSGFITFPVAFMPCCLSGLSQSSPWVQLLTGTLCTHLSWMQRPADIREMVPSFWGYTT